MGTQLHNQLYSIFYHTAVKKKEGKNLWVTTAFDIYFPNTA